MAAREATGTPYNKAAEAVRAEPPVGLLDDRATCAAESPANGMALLVPSHIRLPHALSCSLSTRRHDADPVTPSQVFREVGAAVDSAAAWARYMALGGGAGDAARVVALQYVVGEGPGRDLGGWGACEGPAAPAAGAQLLLVDVAGARTGAFGEDLAIECLAMAYGRDIYVVRCGPVLSQHGMQAGSAPHAWSTHLKA